VYEFVQWSLHFGLIVFDDDHLRRAAALIANFKPWPDADRKRQHARDELPQQLAELGLPEAGEALASTIHHDSVPLPDLALAVDLCDVLISPTYDAVPLPTLRPRPRDPSRHGSGPPWIATPSMQSSLISFSMPVYPGAATTSGYSSRAGVGSRR